MVFTRIHNLVVVLDDAGRYVAMAIYFDGKLNIAGETSKSDRERRRNHER